ncbi:MAG: carboxylating nicotinate-nucleotide diphosphorylase [Actinomycetota bacterium]|nr:carboxylating nicotinate-nucleotide diphosphorylase [Actinomycetota bacterium]
MQDLIDRALAEDLRGGDLTASAVVAPGARARGAIWQKEAGVLAGLEVGAAVFARVDPSVRFSPAAPEGRWSEPAPVVELEGLATSILAAERTALNFLGRLSGTATLTARYVAAVKGTGATILDTRKTTPGMRSLEKAAVVTGGGSSHRAGLFDAILVKENHVRVTGSVGEAARRAVASAAQGVAVEVEVETLGELDEVLDAGVPRVLLDNMSLDDLRAAVELARGRAQLEASGGITLDTVREVAETGVDFISVGALTHSAPALDVSLLLEKR